jgi:hypothetical protein
VSENAEKEIDHEYTSEIVCPKCGYEFSDSWECGGNSEDWGTRCDECETDFRVSRHIEVTYSTRLPDAK